MALALLGLVAVHAPPPVAASLSSGLYFDHAVIIVMENQGVCDIMGNALGWGCPSYSPYMQGLAQNWTLADNLTSLNTGGSGSFSLHNYIGLISGQTWSLTGDDAPDSTTATQNIWSSSNANLGDQLDSASLTWKAYMENMTSNCQGTNGQTYAVRHNPFVYFSDLVSNDCSKIVPAGTGGQLDNSLLSDLGSASAPNVMWLTPNLCDDIHDYCTGPTNQTDSGHGCTSANASICLPIADSYLRHLVPQILGSYAFLNTRAALYLTFDEGNGYCPTGSIGYRDCIYAVWAGPGARTSYLSTNPTYSHYSWLATLESNWQIGYLQNAQTATKMLDMLAPGWTVLPLQWSTTLTSHGGGATFTVTSLGGLQTQISYYTLGIPQYENPLFNPVSPTTLFAGGSLTVTLYLYNQNGCHAGNAYVVFSTPSHGSVTTNGHVSCPLGPG